MARQRRQFNMELFRAFSSMDNGKGLPEQKRVKKVLDWPEWRVDGQFNIGCSAPFRP